MWGNAKGWIISLILAVALGAALARSAVPYQTTAPTRDPALAIATSRISLATLPTSLVPADDPCDAGDNYRAALDAYLKNPAPYDTFRTHAELDRLGEIPAIDQIVGGTHCALMKFFQTHPADLVDYQTTHPQIDSLRKLGELTLAVGILYRIDAKYDQSRKYLDAGFSLGSKLFQERLTFEEFGAGVGLMRSAVQAIAGVAKLQNNSVLTDQCEKLMKDLDALGQKSLEAYKIIGSIDENYSAKYAGDLIEIAQSYQADPMWRVEAVKHLGHYKFNSANRGDQLAARNLIEQLCKRRDIDPALTTAAIAARDLSIEQHHLTR